MSDWKNVQYKDGKMRTSSGGGGGSSSADDVSYDNTTSGMTATNVQDAIDEIAQDFQDGCDIISQAVIAKGQTPASNSPTDIANAISQIDGGNALLFDLGSNFGGTNGTAGNSLYISLSGHVGNKAFLIIEHRDTITLSNAWTLVDSRKNDGYNQWISIYSKIVQNSSETYNISQSSSAVMLAYTVYFPESTNLSFYDNVYMNTSETRYEYICPHANFPLLVIMNNRYASSSDSTSYLVTPKSVGFCNQGRIRADVIIQQTLSNMKIHYDIARDSDQQYNQTFRYKIT